MSPCDELVEVKKSSIHGKGVFARRDIGTGAKIGDFEGVPTNRNGRYVLWLNVDDETWTGIRGTCSLRFLNHSSNPNSEFTSAGELFALREITSGEELTIHYGEDWRNDL